VAPVVRHFLSPVGGYVRSIDCGAVGEAVLHLGGGRLRKEDQIDPAVGVVLSVCVGSPVQAGDVLFTVHAGSEAGADRAEASLGAAFEISQGLVAVVDPVLEVLD
jgi:thymidine phosphorylase